MAVNKAGNRNKDAADRMMNDEGTSRLYSFPAGRLHATLYDLRDSL